MQWLNGNDIGLVFLDINMLKINGIEFLKSVKTNASIIISTAYAEHAAEALGLDVVDFLVKPIAFERFLRACNKAKEIRELKRTSQAATKTSDHFFIKCNNLIENFFYNDLIYAETMLNYVMLYTASKK